MHHLVIVYAQQNQRLLTTVSSLSDFFSQVVVSSIFAHDHFLHVLFILQIIPNLSRLLFVLPKPTYIFSFPVLPRNFICQNKRLIQLIKANLELNKTRSVQLDFRVFDTKKYTISCFFSENHSRKTNKLNVENICNGDLKWYVSVVVY